MTSKISRDLQALEAVRAPSQALIDILAMHHGPEAGAAGGAFLGAVLAFGVAERIAAAAERRKAAGLAPDPDAEARIRRNNDKGLADLVEAQAGFKKLAGAVASLPPLAPAGVATAVQWLGDLKVFIADCEFKPSDVGKLAKLIDENAASVKKGPGALLDSIISKLAELETARKRPDRGAVDNIPLWKLIAIAVYLGIALIAVTVCLVRRNNCAALIQALAAAGTSLVAIVSLFC
jgi:hypothetical protein